MFVGSDKYFLDLSFLKEQTNAGWNYVISLNINICTTVGCRAKHQTKFLHFILSKWVPVTVDPNTLKIFLTKLFMDIVNTFDGVPNTPAQAAIDCIMASNTIMKYCGF